MKKIFNLVVFFFILAFTLVLSLLSEPSFVHAQQPLTPRDYITGVKSDTVVLISNNVLREEISSRQKENNNNFTGFFPYFINYKLNKDLFYKDVISYNWNYSYRLSNDTPKEQKIRAP